MIDPLKCNIICLECKGGDAEAVGACTDGYCPMNGSRVSDKPQRAEKPVFGEPKGREALNRSTTPMVTDNKVKPWYKVTVTEGKQEGDADQ